MLFCQASHLHVCLIPLFLDHVLIIIFAIFFSIEYFKMRNRQHESNHNDREKAAADYVYISAAAFVLSSVFWIVNGCILLSYNVEARLFKTISVLVDQLNGIWNILALYAVMDDYRAKLKKIIRRNLLRCKSKRNVERVEPALETIANISMTSS